MPRLTVEADGSKYEVVVGADVLSVVGDELRGRRRVAMVSQQRVDDLYGDALRRALHTAGVQHDTYLMGDGEPAKSLNTVEELCRGFARDGLLRDDAVVALGGGVVGDTVGFAAAAYHRGVDVVQVPTTLQAQVDAAIGGKTGVNLPEGKNLVGAFHQPVAVVADVTMLTSLPDRVYRGGLGEVAKYALMGSQTQGSVALVDFLRLDTDKVLERDPDALAILVALSAAVKIVVVNADPQERTGLRATLNYGHTLGHALETAGEYDLLHGEAVAIGLMFAVQLAFATGRVGLDEVDRHEALLASLGLPTTAPAGRDTDELLTLMSRDKKGHGGLTFIIRNADGLERLDDPPADALHAAFHAVGIN